MTKTVFVLSLVMLCSAAFAGWTTECVDGTRLGQYSSMALDTEGNAHISTVDPRDNSLKYVYQSAPGVWQMETVDSGTCRSFFSAITVDAGGTPHIAYFNCDGMDLNYAVRDGSGWHLETVETDGYVGEFPAIAVDARGFVHVSCLDRSGPEYPVYALRDNSGWHVTRLEDQAGAGGNSSIAVDSRNYPHMTFSGNSPGTVKYAFQDDTGWTVENVAGDGVHSIIALDSTDTPHICFCDGINRNLKYAVRDAGGGWTVEAVDEDWSAANFYISMQLDAADVPHIAYQKHHENSVRSLNYARRDAGGWHLETLEDGYNSTGHYVSLALDAQGYPHVSYLNEDTHLFGFTHEDASGWHSEPITAGGPAGRYASLAFAANGTAHISYYDQMNDDLKHTYQDAQGWHEFTVDSAGAVGTYTSLATDSDGFPHIAYMDDSNKNLKYAYLDNAGWHTENVDLAGDVGYFTSMVLDSSDVPHISYRDWTNFSVKYATRSGSVWQTETVDTVGAEGSATSIALDPQGYPCISYGNGSLQAASRALKYARYDGTQWLIEAVTTDDMNVMESSLVVDSAGTAHIAFFSVNGYCLNYAVQTAGGWSIEMVDDEYTRVGQDLSLVLDAAGRPCISYAADDRDNLKYAFFDEDEWKIETAAANTGAQCTSLALDGSGSPCIAYCSEDYMLAFATQVNPFVELNMPNYYVSPGSWFQCNAICSCSHGFEFPQASLFVLLELGGNFYFAPTFSAYDYYTVDIETEVHNVSVLEGFYWPDNTGNGSATWYAAVLNPAHTQIISNIEIQFMKWGE